MTKQLNIVLRDLDTSPEVLVVASVINSFAALCRLLLTGILLLFQNLPPIYGLTFLSVLTGIFILLIFRFTSNRDKLDQVKNHIKADILKVWLFNHDFIVVLKTQGALFLDNLRYIRHTFPSFLIMIIPILSVLVVSSAWFDHRPLRPAETILVTLAFRSETSPDIMEIIPQFPESLRATAPPVRVESLRQISYRVQANKTGEHCIKWMVNGKNIEKKITVSNKSVPVFPLSVRSTIKNSFFHFASPSLSPEGPIESINVLYPERTISIWGWNINWLVVFFAGSLITIMVFKNILGIVL